MATINLVEQSPGWLAVVPQDLVAHAFVASRREQFGSRKFDGESTLCLESERVNKFMASAAARGVSVELI